MHANGNNSEDLIQNQRSREARKTLDQLNKSDLIKLVHALYDVRTRRDALDVLSKVVNYLPVSIDQSLNLHVYLFLNSSK